MFQMVQCCKSCNIRSHHQAFHEAEGGKQPGQHLPLLLQHQQLQQHHGGGGGPGGAGHGEAPESPELISTRTSLLLIRGVFPKSVREQLPSFNNRETIMLKSVSFSLSLSLFVLLFLSFSFSFSLSLSFSLCLALYLSLSLARSLSLSLSLFLSLSLSPPLPHSPPLPPHGHHSGCSTMLLGNAVQVYIKLNSSKLDWFDSSMWMIRWFKWVTSLPIARINSMLISLTESIEPLF